MLYDAVCHANLQSVIRYPYPMRIRGIVENDIRIYPYPQKFTDIRAPLLTTLSDIQFSSETIRLFCHKRNQMYQI